MNILNYEKNIVLSQYMYCELKFCWWCLLMKSGHKWKKLHSNFVMNEKKYAGSFFRLIEDLTYADVKFLLKHGLYSYEEKKRLAYDIHKKHNTL